MSFFLYSYKDHTNFLISKEQEIFGCRDSDDGLPTKFKLLKKGDIIIIRNGNEANLKFYGYGVVLGNSFRNNELVWHDEIAIEKSIYPNKIHVDFTSNNFQLENINNLSWNSIIGLSIRNKKGKIMDSPQSLGKFISGNFIEQQYEERFKEIIGYKEINSVILDNNDEQIIKPIFSEEENLKTFLENITIGNEEDLELTSRTLREQNIIDRDRSIVKKLKIHYENKCQLCETQIILQDGRNYSEVHHLHPLGENGFDVAENMIVVCPNCHVELDFGKAISKDDIYIKEPHFIDDKYFEFQNNKHKSII